MSIKASTAAVCPSTATRSWASRASNRSVQRCAAEFKDRGRVFRAVPERRGEPLARTVEPVAERLAALDQGFVQAIGDAVEPYDQVVAAQDHGVVEARLAVVDAIDQRLGALAEIPSQRIARFDQASSDRLALFAERVHRLRALGAEAAHNLLGVAVDGVAHQERGVGEPARDGLSVRPDGFGGFREAGGDAFAVRLQGFDRDGAARADPAGDGVGVGADRVLRQIGRLGEPRRDGFAARADRVENPIIARVNAPDDRVGVGVDRGPGQVGRVRELRRDGVSLRAHGLDGVR